MRQLLCVVGAAFAASSAMADVTGTFGGHSYTFVEQGEYFDQARTNAKKMGGYLANVTSQPEQEFIYTYLSTSYIAWLGGSDESEEGIWRWLDGPEAGKSFYSYLHDPVDLSYQNFLVNEPNNNLGGPLDLGPNENSLVIIGPFTGPWGDLNGTRYQWGYIVERDYIAAAPEPSSWAMMVAGFGFAGAAMRRRRARFCFA